MTHAENQTTTGLPTLRVVHRYCEAIKPVIDTLTVDYQRIVLRKRVDVLLAQNAEAPFKLAIIGQFSAGKSTFINALLRDNLLKTKNEATTAVATFVKKSEKPTLRVTFNDNNVITVSEDDYTELDNFLRRLYSAKPGFTGNFHQYVNLLTTHKEVSAAVLRVEIGYPVPTSLLDNLVVIDTPGLFAGMSHTAGHERITRNIIDEEADSLAVLLPAHQAISKSLLDFLRGLPACLLHRCVFIASRMDMVEEEEEREELLDFIQAQLTQALGIEKPVLLSCSALSVLPEMGKTNQPKRHAARWHAEFVETETTLGRLLHNKTALLAEKMDFQAKELQKDMLHELVAMQKKLLAEIAAHDKTRMAEIDKVLPNLYAKIRDALQQYKATVIKLIEKQAKPILDMLQQSGSGKIYSSGHKIYDAYSWIPDTLQDELTEELKKVIQLVNAELHNMKDVCKNIGLSVNKALHQYYPAFPAAEMNFNASAITWYQVGMVKDDFYAYKRIMENENTHEDEITGFFVKMGRWLKVTNTSDLQSALIRALNEKLKDIVPAALHRVIFAVNNIFAIAAAALNDKLAAYANQHKDELVRLSSAHGEKEQMLKEQLWAIEHDIRTVSVYHTLSVS